MEDIHHLVLKDSLTYLKKNLQPKDVLDHLYESEILTDEQLQRLHAETTSQSCVRELVAFMLPKTGPKGFNCFIQALCDTNFKYIAEFLKDKEKILRQKQTIEAQNNNICKWLQGHIRLCKNPLPLADLHKFVRSNCPVDLKGRELVVQDTLQFVRHILPAAVADSEDTDSDLFDTVYIEVVSKGTSTCEKAVQSCTFGTENKYKAYMTTAMESWSVGDVSDWLHSIGISDSIIEQFCSEEIDGYSLVRIKESNLEKMNLKIGVSIKIIGKRDEFLAKGVLVVEKGGENNDNGGDVNTTCPEVVLKSEIVSDDEEPIDESFLSISCQSTSEAVVSGPTETLVPAVSAGGSEPSVAAADTVQCSGLHPNYELNLKEDEPLLKLPPSELLRKFDTPVDITFKYKKSAQLSCIESRPGGNLLLPVHRFVLTDMSTPEGLLEFSRETVKFVCACLNDRANGTIHFGIASQDSSPLFSGCIVGTALRGQQKSYDSYLTKALKNCFFEDQIDCVLNCVRPPVFVEVVPSDIGSLFIIEVDVIAQHRWCEDRAFYAKLPTMEKKNFEDMSLYRIIDGKPRALVPQECERFMAIKGKLADDRKEQEESSCASHSDIDIDTDLKKKFVHLLCDGEENLHGDHYLILVLNSPEEHMTDEWFKENLSFLSVIEWKAVFDFDREARICQWLQNQDEMMKIAVSDDFNPRSKDNVQDPDQLRQLHDDLRNSIHPSWVFVNGYFGRSGEESLSPVQWKTRKSDGLKEAVRFFSSEIPLNRATIVFLLFSKDTAVILEAAEVFVTSFVNHWLCVADTENIGKPWVEELLRRNCIESPDDRIVLGMPWKHINETVLNIQGPKNKVVCELPTSTGATIILKAGTQHELFDLEVLSSTQCDREYDLMNSRHQEELKRGVETDFYRGGSPSWWNFWFRNQVCEREIHGELKDVVMRALSSKSDDTIDRVYIYHQPGAGGTTTAKHVLWDLRKFYRVGIIRNITDGQTAEQILKLYQYEDWKPRPVLLLLDNPEEERANLLFGELEEMVKKQRMHHDDQSKLICVFLVCLRRTQVSKKFDPRQSNKFDPKCVTLKHELSESERHWFKDKSRMLQTQYDKQLYNVDPRLLISFNILKENFKKDFIKRMVKDFVADIINEKERNLLKYISLINAFDLEFRPLPSSAFDNMMVELFWMPGPRRGKNAVCNRWENKLSHAVRILLNETSKPAMGHIHSLRVINPLLSKEILLALTSASGGREVLSHIALGFFNCKDIFNMKSITRDNLLRIVKDVLKHRGRLPNGLPETAFAPLIQEIVDSESLEKAGEVLERGFNLTEDPFVAQQLARLFIKSQSWEKAEKFAKIATTLKPDNSYLWDTYGRIFEQRLVDEYGKLVSSSRLIPVTESFQIIQLGIRGMEIFRKVQSISEQEKAYSPNNSGFFGELQMIVCLLDCLNYVDTFQDKDDLRRFIMDEAYVPGDLSMLADVNGQNYLEELKKLSQYVETAMNRIEDELIQLRTDIILDARRRDVRYATDSLTRLKENFNMYFGEETDEPPQEMLLEEQCQYRRRRIFRLAGNNLGSIFDLRWTSSGDVTLDRICCLAHSNINTEHVNAHDYLTLISVSLALTSLQAHDTDGAGSSMLYKASQTTNRTKNSVEDQCPHEGPDPFTGSKQATLDAKNVNFDDMVSWSKKLYEARETLHALYLEPYLFLVMFNWPRKNTKHNLPIKQIEMALRQWKEAYNKKYPRQCDDGKSYRKKDTTLFFLASGNDMASIYTTCEERNTRRALESRGDSSFWRQPDIMRKLQRFQGVLSRGGNEVVAQLEYGQGHKRHISIATSLPIWDRTKWNRQVFFVIGFSWIGPKAFDITLEDPTIDAKLLTDHPVVNTYAQTGITWIRRKPSEEITQEQFHNELTKLDRQLSYIRTLKQKSCQLTLEEQQVVSNEAKLQLERQRLFEQRWSIMKSRIPEFS